MKKLKILLSVLFFLGIHQNTYADTIKKNADYLITFNTTIDEEIISSNDGEIKETFPNLAMVKAEFPYNPNDVLIHNKKIKRVEKDEIVKARCPTNLF
ncbi:hypothetical protein ABDI49_18230 [Bacillus cereus]